MVYIAYAVALGYSIFIQGRLCKKQGYERTLLVDTDKEKLIIHRRIQLAYMLWEDWYAESRVFLSSAFGVQGLGIRLAIYLHSKLYLSSCLPASTGEQRSMSLFKT